MQRYSSKAVGASAERVKTTTRQMNLIQFGEENLDLNGLEQLVEKSQTLAIAEALCLLRAWIGQPHTSGSSLAQLLKRMDAEFNAKVQRCSTLTGKMPLLLDS